MLKKYPQLLIAFLLLATSLLACARVGIASSPLAASTSLNLPETAQAGRATTLTADACHNNTRNEGECKDCCDALDSDSAGRKGCRDACPGHDFSQNANFIQIVSNSMLGPDGDYSACTASGEQGGCKDCCDSSTSLQSGDRRFCRDACNKLPDIQQNPANEQPAPGGIQSEAMLSPVVGEYVFAEGPAADAQGNVYFSDISAGRIYKWSPDGDVIVFLEGLKGPNGLAFTRDGLLIVCEGGNGRLISVDSQGNITPLVEQYQQIRFNEPNDLWIDPQGGIYFTDPAYQSPVVQDGEHVYYLTPDRSQVLRVISDLTRPNGIVGTPDGKTLYVADHGSGQTFVYKIQQDGSLTDKRLFVPLGSDGMELDQSGNLYLTTGNAVKVIDPSGKQAQEIKLSQPPTNLVFGGVDRTTLFITARRAVYTLPMPVDKPVSADPIELTISPNPDSFTLSSSEVLEGGALPTEYTCDGVSSTLPLAWSGAPAGTASYAIVMHHVANPTDIHWYWVLYNIAPNVTSLSKNSARIGTLGTNSVNGKTEYAPPCSKGPGLKTYTYTVYALSAQPQLSLPASQVDRAVLLAAIQNITLASAELNVTYTRK